MVNNTREGSSFSRALTTDEPRGFSFRMARSLGVHGPRSWQDHQRRVAMITRSESLRSLSSTTRGMPDTSLLRAVNTPGKLSLAVPGLNWLRKGHNLVASSNSTLASLGSLPRICPES